MGRRIFKWLAPICIGAIIIGGSLNHNSTTQPIHTYATSVVHSDYSYAIISHNPLNTKIREMLHKDSNINIAFNEFMNNSDFAPTTVVDPETSEETTTIPTYQLDLSNTGITDIRELAQFELPENIQGINLAGNGITEKDLSSITTLLNLSKGDTITINSINHEVRTNFKTQIKKVLLDNNEIDLESQPARETLSDTRLLFGVQNAPVSDNPLVKVGEIKPMYYIRKNSDENFLTFTFTYDQSTLPGKKVAIVYDTPTEILNQGNDEYTITVNSIPNSETAYFKDYSSYKEYQLFDIKLKSDFTVERNSLLNLNITSDYKLTPDSPIILSGFGNQSNVKVIPSNASTSQITKDTHKNYVNIEIQYNGYSKTVPVEFKVVDTIFPVIRLIGTSHAETSLNEAYNDPGAIYFDPSSEGATRGEDLSHRKKVTSTIKVDTLGSYHIDYSVSDDAGNTTTVRRFVDVVEKAFTKVVVRSSTQEILDGKSVVLTVQPESGVDISQFESITYYWYLNGSDKPFDTSTGDKQTGQSSIPITANSETMKYIKVYAEAIKKSDGETVRVPSNELTLNIKANYSATEMIILSASIAVLILKQVIASIALIKYSKAKSKTSGKRHKNFVKGKKNSSNTATNNEKENIKIEVIKDYNGTPPTQNTAPKTENPKPNNTGDQPVQKDNSKFDPNNMD